MVEIARARFPWVAFFLLSFLEFVVYSPAHTRSYNTVLTYVPMCFDSHTRTPRNTGIPGFIVLDWYCIFCKLNICGNPASNMCISTIFPTEFANFMSLGHILVILTIFQTLLLLYLLWSVINDLWCYCYNLPEAQLIISIFKQYSFFLN